MITIYKIQCPNTFATVYIGRTSKPLYLRLYGHIANDDGSDRFKWMQNIILLNSLPLIQEIEVVEDMLAAEREKYWIDFYTNAGCDLFNQKVGGYRKNAKRPLKYGEPTELVPVRVPKSKKKEFKKLIEPILQKWEVDKNGEPLAKK